jgi:8-oxo-dGTP pyrophosphatase MutT (NUDIX family)
MINDAQLTTLLFLRRGGKVLLAMKKRGFGEGRWNGVGGKVEADESTLEAAIREAQEEIKVTPRNPMHMGTLTFHYAPSLNNSGMHVRCEVYVCDNWGGKPTETEEMAPQWFPVNELPLGQMWADDRFWLPLVLEGKRVEAAFDFDAAEKVIRHQVQVIE